MFNAIGRVSAEQTIDQSIADADVRCAFEMINSECTKGKASRSALPSIFAACCTSDEHNIACCTSDEYHTACCTSDECSVCSETFSSDQQQKRRQGLGHVDAHTGVTCATGLRCGCVCVSTQPTSGIPSHSLLSAIELARAALQMLWALQNVTTHESAKLCVAADAALLSTLVTVVRGTAARYC